MLNPQNTRHYLNKEDFEAQNILFQQEDRANYIKKMLEKCLQGNTESAT
jgi:hypothetical protein